MAEHAGLNNSIIRALRAIYGQMRRRFKINGNVGASFYSHNGILQGCPLSIVLLNLLMEVWGSMIEDRHPGVKARSYADDASVTTKMPARTLASVLQCTEDFCTLTGMKLNIPKSHLWSCSVEGRRQLKRIFPTAGHEEVPTLVMTEKTLGAQLCFTRQHRNNPDTVPRNKAAQQVCTRIEAVPLPLEAKAALVEGAAMPKVLYDCAVAHLPKRNLNNWRTRAV